MKPPKQMKPPNALAMAYVSPFQQQNPQLGAISESWSFTVSWSWRALTCASCCSTLDETGTSSDVLYTFVNSLGRCLTGTWQPTAFTSITWGILRNRTRFMPTLDSSELEVTLGCFFATHANLGWESIRPFFSGAGELVLFVSLVAAAALSSCL